MLTIGLVFTACEQTKQEGDDNKQTTENPGNDQKPNDDQKPEEPEDDKKPEGISSDCYVYSAQYAVDDLGGIYILNFVTNDLKYEGQNIIGSGDDLVVMLYAMPQEDGYPLAKTYNVVIPEQLKESDTECVLGGYVENDGNPYGTYAFVVENGEITDGLLCTGGTIKFEGNATKGTMTANLDFINSKGATVTKKYVYSGTMELEKVNLSAPAAPTRAPKMK